MSRMMPSGSAANAGAAPACRFWPRSRHDAPTSLELDDESVLVGLMACQWRIRSLVGGLDTYYLVARCDHW
jgi:hypothetical protein